MKKQKLITWLCVTALMLPPIILTSCTKKIQTASSQEIGLKYGFKGEMPYFYSIITDVNQLILFGGQEISAIVENSIAFEIEKTDESEDVLSINVKVDSIFGAVKSMQGDMIKDSKEVRGKDFNMKLSVRGEESEMEEAAAITYISVGEQETNLKLTFGFLFPDLPEGATGVGYTWSDSDTIDLSVNDQTALMIINSKNKIVSKETFKGLECYKIEYLTSGERTASGNTPQGYMSSSGDITGSGYFYFSPVEGVMVGDYSKQTFEGEITIPTGESLPMQMDINVKTELKR